ncbi:CsbD family protein [Microbacterium sp. ZXX196]|uniref:CsbD family protein n=1 Tax=Microbacterium sp. ZXX196 TaxID=2609291 RepID=UPI0012B990A0|nr:CsbD family protein [Microbacterium sp. ZXX196]MTE23237.1 CsbD family protein [Microbacterium sp. ZXX196]
MSNENKFEAAADKLKGKAKETWGRVTDDDELQAEGQADQAAGHTKDAAENVKDAAKNVGKSFGK